MRPKKTSTMFVGLVLLAAFTALPAFDSWSMGSRVPTVGMQAEDFQLADLDGKSQSLSQYRGKIVLLNFWATWCKPCTTEMPAMQTIYDKLRDKGFVVLAVNELEN
ncbi:MAG TPA: redoxin domain-containing protein, partial [Nitrospiraceae bacterium]|nr:redoxin domain-containing protein [Nitrospiraceae bacterium]